MPRPWRCRRLRLASLLRFPGPATRHPLQTDSEYSTGGRVRTSPARRLSMFGRPWRLRCSQSFTPGSKRLLVTGALPATLSLTHPASDLDVSGHRPLQKDNTIGLQQPSTLPLSDITWNDNPALLQAALPAPPCWPQYSSLSYRV